MHTSFIPYQDQGVELEAFVAYPSQEGKHPLVVLCHPWKGRDEFISEKARLVAKLGYVGFALDMYGRGVVGKSKEENAALKKPFIQDRHLLQRRLLKGFEEASQLALVDPKRIGAVGFGFGGICALDLARSGVDIRGVVSVYGHFDPPPAPLIKPIRAKILALHGYNDPIVSQAELRRFEQEMNGAKVDWETHIYGNAMHAFALPGANDPEAGILYHPINAARAWGAVCSFLGEVLA